MFSLLFLLLMLLQSLELRKGAALQYGTEGVEGICHGHQNYWMKNVGLTNYFK